VDALAMRDSITPALLFRSLQQASGIVFSVGFFL
jgi:hypothetical protein